MKGTAVFLSMFFLTAVFGSTQDTAKPSETAKPIDALAWLVGGVWTADTSTMGYGMQRIETSYQWSDNHAYMRFTTHFVFDKGTARTYDGNLFWNPEQKSLAMWYMSAENEIIESPMKIDGDIWTMTFRGTDPEGKMSDLRAEVTRKSPDFYHWLVREKQSDAWKEIMALDYHRVAGS